MQLNNDDLCSILYEKYYKAQNFSKQTSSFWRKYGDFQKVTKSGNDYQLKGAMFGDYRQRSIIETIKNIPTSIYLSKLLKNCDKDIIEAIKFVRNKTLRTPSYDLARMALTLNMLRRELYDLEEKKFCIIGDGYGSLGCLIKRILPNSKIISINLGRTLFFDVYYTQMVFPHLAHALRSSNDNIISKDFTFIEAEEFDQIDADIFINICSMMEMNHQDIKSYFEAIRNQDSETWFYCCNRISKELPDGTVTKFDEYPWVKEDEIIYDQLCPWHKEYPSNRPPFIRRFPPNHMKHRLIKVALKQKPHHTK